MATQIASSPLLQATKERTEAIAAALRAAGIMASEVNDNEVWFYAADKAGGRVQFQLLIVPTDADPYA